MKMTPGVRRIYRHLFLSECGGRAIVRTDTALTREEWRAISLYRLRRAMQLAEC